VVAFVALLVGMTTQASALVPGPEPLGGAAPRQVPPASADAALSTDLQWLLVVVIIVAALAVGAGLVLAARRLRGSRPRLAA
jgi:hypothetical protein